MVTVAVDATEPELLVAVSV
jgi:hypothetical protein